MTEEEVLKKLSEYGEAIKKMKEKIDQLTVENEELKNNSKFTSEEVLKAFESIDTLITEDSKVEFDDLVESEK